MIYLSQQIDIPADCIVCNSFTFQAAEMPLQIFVLFHFTHQNTSLLFIASNVLPFSIFDLVKHDTQHNKQYVILCYRLFCAMNA